MAQRDWRQIVPQQVIPIKWLRYKATVVDRWDTMSGEVGHIVYEDADGNFWECTDWTTDTQAVLMDRVTTE